MRPTPDPPPPTVPLEGLLVIDKPEGPTSHDVVARLRRVLGERRIGHTGTLDPLASGVLPIVIGRATRLARFLTSDDKRYHAVVRLGQATTTCDRQGDPVGEGGDASGVTREAVEHALDRFRGPFAQTPPAYSAKKVGGVAAYVLARRGQAAPLAPVRVTLHTATVTAMAGPDVALELHCSAGFYVRSLAHDLGESLGCGAHLWSLRRSASGPFTIEEAVALEAVEADPALAGPRLLPMAALLTDWPAVVVTAEGVTRVRHGVLLGPRECTVWHDGAGAGETDADGVGVRVLGPDGSLVALAGWTASAGFTRGLLHPRVVLV